MKKIIALSLILVILLSCVGCGKQEGKKNMEPQVSQMKAICELAVMDCYYHNVAKYLKEGVEGSLWWKKDKHFWVEYSGVVKLGIDVSLVNIEVADTQITITMPEAKVLGSKVDSASLNKDSFIIDKDSVEPSADDEVKAFELAQAKLQEMASNDKTLLASAQQRAQALLEDYIYNIGNAVGKNYSIKWIYLDANGEPVNSSSFITTAPTEDSGT